MKFKFRGLKEDYTAAGTLRWRVRMDGNPNKLTPIPMGPGEPGFHEHYAAARAGEKLQTVKPAKVKTGTLDAMCDEFLAWMEEQVAAGNLSKLTLSSRRTGLTQACDVKDPDGDRMGSLNADLPRAAFIHIRDSFGGRTGAAATCLKALRAAYTWGQDRNYPADSPVFAVKSGHKPKGGATPWKARDIEKFMTTHVPGTMARLWFVMTYATYSRIGDAPTLGPDNEVIHDGVLHIEWQPSKKGSAFVSVPAADYLAEELERHTRSDTYLVTEYGTPFASSGSLDNRVRKWIIQAGLCAPVLDAKGKPELDSDGKPKIRATHSQHGVRKGVAELMAERGASEYEIMSSFGWTETKTAAIYTNNFKRRGLAASAAKRMSAPGDGPRPESRGPHLDQNTSKIRGGKDKWQPVGACRYLAKTSA